MKTISPPGFKERTKAYFIAAAEAVKNWYGEEGNWLLDSRPPETRERFWIAFSLYARGEVGLADAIIRRGETLRYGKVIFDIFDTTAFVIFSSTLAVYGSIFTLALAIIFAFG